MESLDQIQLLYINFALLMLTSSIALYLPRKMKQTAVAHKPKYHPEITKFYQALNQSLKMGQPLLTYIVDPIPVRDFVGFYKGLEEIHGFKVDLKCKYHKDGSYTEYIVLDLQKYTGPRQVDVAVTEQRFTPPAPPTPAELYQQAIRNKPQMPPSMFFQNSRPANILSMVRKPKPSGDPTKKVVDLASYRKNKTINYVSGGNEGA